MRPAKLAYLLPSLLVLGLMAGCSSSRVTWIPDDKVTAIPIAEIDHPLVAQARIDLEAAIKASQAPEGGNTAKEIALKAEGPYRQLFSNPSVPPEKRGLASYNIALTFYLAGDLEGAATAADLAQTLAPDAPFIAALANRLERQLARDRVEGFQRLLAESERSRKAAEEALSQARTSEAAANTAVAAARSAEVQANSSREDARKAETDANRKLAIATARFDITLDDVSKAEESGDLLLAGVLTQALLRAHANDPEILTFVERQVSKDLTEAASRKDLGTMKTQLAGWQEAIRLALETVGTTDRASALVASLKRLDDAQAMIDRVQQEIWTEMANGIIGEELPNESAAIRRQLEAIEVAAAALPEDAQVRTKLSNRKIKATDALKFVLEREVKQRFTKLDELVKEAKGVPDLQALRIDAEELMAFSIVAATRDGVDRQIATKCTDLKDRIEATLQTAGLRQMQEIADKDAVTLLYEIEYQYIDILKKVQGHPARANGDKFFSSMGAWLSQLEKKAMRVDGLCSSNVQEWAREEMQKIGKLAGEVAMLQRTAYNLWAMENIQSASSTFKEGKGWFNDDEAKFKAALKKYIGRIDTAILDPPVMSMYRTMFDKLFSQIDLDDQVDVSRSMVEVPSRLISEF